ncbi:UTRA domain-containing protein [Neomoorella carbonis]
MSAGRASQEEARYLQCRTGSPVLIVSRTTCVAGGLLRLRMISQAR